MDRLPKGNDAAHQVACREDWWSCGRILSAWIAVVLFCWSAGAPGCAAEGQVSPPGGWIPNAQNSNRDSLAPTPELSAKQIRALNEQRQKQIVSDTERLLQLAEELNRELEGSNTVPASEEMRKVSQIEKLARSVKDKMRDAVTAGPTVVIPQAPWRP